MTFSLLKWATLASGMLASGAALAGSDPEFVYRGIGFACTGIAFESRDDPRWAKYPTKLVFTQGQGEYIADVAVTIDDVVGTQVFEARCKAPWLLVDLPPGRYRVSVTARDAFTREFDLTVGYGDRTEQIIRFPEITN